MEERRCGNEGIVKNGEYTMVKPKMILFDYGQTLGNEARFDGVKGTEAVLSHAVENRRRLTAEQVQAEANAINKELGRFDPEKRHLFWQEVPNHMFTKFLYESLGIRLSLSSEEIDRIFWNTAAPGKPTEGIAEFLQFLKKQNIRTGVISNICYCGKVVEERINSIIPDNEFEFIIATSEYLFRKPNKRIFDLALEKAGLSAAEVWYIGDQYECDIVGAENAGMHPVWYLGAIDMPYREREGVHTVRSWAELQRQLEM